MSKHSFAKGSGTTSKSHDGPLFKLLMVGESQVGKSSLLLRFSDDKFSPNFLTTIGIDFRIRSITVNNQAVRLQIWDTSGQERFRSITTSYFRGAHGMILVFDLTDRESFKQIRYWMNTISAHGSAGCLVCLVGNKHDVASKKKFEGCVTSREAQELAALLKVDYYETSAKYPVINGQNSVDHMFIEMSRKMMYLASKPPVKGEKNIMLSSQPKPKSKCCRTG